MGNAGSIYLRGQRVAKKTTLNAKNLEALGVERLAELLIEISTGDAAAKRRLRMELAGAGSPGELAKEIPKRLTSIARSQSFIDWRSVRAIDLRLLLTAHAETGDLCIPYGRAGLQAFDDIEGYFGSKVIRHGGSGRYNSRAFSYLTELPQGFP